VGMQKIVIGLSALVAVGALAACSSTAAANETPLAKGTTAAATSTVDTTTSAPPTTTVPPTTTTVVPTTTKAPPVTTKAPVIQAAAPPAAAPGVPCVAAAKACVDIATRQAWLIQNGQVVLGPVKIMPGRPGFRTPVGTFHVLSKAAHFWSTAFNAPMPDSVFFLPGFAFHIGSLSVFSHGCIHLSSSAGATFFNTLHVGDEVQILSH
jgi:lipoprotein-anchoring transpeptidase ErfK/SrfK